MGKGRGRRMNLGRRGREEGKREPRTKRERGRKEERTENTKRKRSERQGIDLSIHPSIPPSLHPPAKTGQ